MRRPSWGLFLAFLVGMLALAPLTQANWPIFHADAGHTGVGTGDPILTPLILWNFSTPGNPIYSSPVIENGTVYIDVDDSICALNASTGTIVWRYVNYSIMAGPSVANGIVYSIVDFNLCAFNATNGILLWSFPFDWMVTFDPTIVDGVVYVGITGLNGGYPSDRFFAINATNGESLWNLTSTVDVRGSPVFYNGFVYVDYDDSWHTLHAINVTTGADVWSIPLGISAGPIVAEGILYAGLGNSTFLALNATDGEVIWEANYVDSPEWTHCPAIWNDSIFVSTYEGDMDALNASNGEILWSFTTDERWGINGVSDSPAVAGGVLYFGTLPGWVYALNATTGAQIWRWETPRFSDNGMAICSSPAVDSGVLYIASFYGCLYAFTNAPPPTPTPTPQPTTTATSKPTQTTTPTTSPKPTATPTPTPIEIPTATPTTQPPQTQPTTKPENNNQLTTIAVAAVITVAVICAAFLLIKRKC